MQALLSINNSGETYSAVPTNEFARSAAFERERENEFSDNPQVASGNISVLTNRTLR